MTMIMIIIMIIMMIIMIIMMTTIIIMMTMMTMMTMMVACLRLLVFYFWSMDLWVAAAVSARIVLFLEGFALIVLRNAQG
jgi:hypothetical protein